MKPALLLDIDGVLCPFGDDPPEGYNQLFLGSGDWVWISPANTDRLRRLLPVFEVIWCTGWEHTANSELLIPHDLSDPFPVIEFGRDEHGVLIQPHHPDYNADTWKLPWVKRWAGTRELAWIDDELRKDALDWAEARSIEGVPTLMIRTDASEGMRENHVEELLEFARSLVAEETS